MSYKIKINPANIEYQATTDVTLLSAALTNQLSLQHSCKKGSCGVCSADVLAGLVKNECGDLVSSGTVLTCCSYAQSDVTLNANYYAELDGIECLTVPCKITSYHVVTEDIIVLTLRLPPTTAFKYLPGQYIDLIQGGVRRSYSIANAQSNSSGIELHIKLLQNGEFSHILRQSTINQLMRIEGPKGTFFVRDASNPIVFLAGGTGFAPVKAMVEGLLANHSRREIYIYWGMPHSSSLYSDVAKIWSTKFDNVHYIPVISSEDLDWRGRIGFVHQAVVDDFSHLGDYHVYACGASQMITAARAAFMAKGLEEKHFYSDTFVPSK
jgi:CDP-4-dehydro-6-deoxyglucose reductase, E3